MSNRFVYLLDESEKMSECNHKFDVKLLEGREKKKNSFFLQLARVAPLDFIRDEFFL